MIHVHASTTGTKKVTLAVTIDAIGKMLPLIFLLSVFQTDTPRTVN